MGVVRYLTIRLVLSILSIGLLSSQVCNVVCIYADRHESMTINIPKQSSNTSHCHQDQGKEEQQDRSHQCPKHYDIVSIQPDSQIASDLIQQNFNHGFAIALIAFSDSLARSATTATNNRVFRPPPHQSLHSVLRI
jgi:hypothetical protein